MSKDLFEFHWEVPEGGYRWVDNRPLPGNCFEGIDCAHAAENTLSVLISHSAWPRPARRYAPFV